MRYLVALLMAVTMLSGCITITINQGQGQGQAETEPPKGAVR